MLVIINCKQIITDNKMKNKQAKYLIAVIERLYSINQIYAKNRVTFNRTK